MDFLQCIGCELERNLLAQTKTNISKCDMLLAYLLCYNEDVVVLATGDAQKSIGGN